MTDNANNKKSQWEKFQSRLATLGTVVGSIAAIFGVIYGIPAFIDNRVNKIVQDENYVRRIASEVRPSVIFNGKGNVLVDQGGMRFLDGKDGIQILDYQKDAPWTNVPGRILIHPKQFLAYAPLLTPLVPTVSGSDVERTNELDFVYTVYGGMMVTWTPPQTMISPKFRLEILQ